MNEIRVPSDDSPGPAPSPQDAETSDLGPAESAVDTTTVVGGAPDSPWARPDEAAERSVAPGSNVGRYVMLHEVGRGGMGRVVRAYDPKLQREVALKLVRAEALDSGAWQDIMREARAMAKLSHPNVVGVYDTEESPDGLVLVMEYVEGQTLLAWLRQHRNEQRRPEDWRAVVERFTKAGHGLVAAHAVDMLHRDFKPANVLVSQEGRVKVTDFGLAKLVVRFDGVSPPERSPSYSHHDDLETQSGTIRGTPRYMAPEQHRGQRLTAAVDQYAFCVALWEALVGKPPFAGRDPLLAKLRGPAAWPSDASGVPAPIVAALERGLAARPEDRWPSMQALLDALTFDSGQRRNRWVRGVGALGLLSLGGVGAWAWQQARDERCSGARQELAAVWDGDRREQLGRGFAAAGGEFGERAWERTGPRLDDYTEQWVAMHTEVCEATAVRGEQSAEVMDLRMACLGKAREDLGAAVGIFAEADFDTTVKAHEVVDRLRPLSRCEDVEALESEVAPPPDHEAPTVAEIRALLASGRALRVVGKYSEAEQTLAEVDERLPLVEYGPIVAEVEIVRGRVFESHGDHDAAVDALRVALESAVVHEQWDLVFEASTSLMTIVGDRQGRPLEALRYRELASGLTRGDPIASAQLHDSLGIVLQQQGKLDEAEGHRRQSLELRRQELGPEHYLVGHSLNSLAVTLNEMARYDEAEVEFERSRRVLAVALGSNHPDVAMSNHNISSLLMGRGKYEEAEAAARAAWRAWDEALGPKHERGALARLNLANALVYQNRLEEGEVHLREVLVRLTAALGPDHPKVAMVRSNLSGTLGSMKKFPEAEAEARLAITAAERAMGPRHHNVAIPRANLGQALEGQGRIEEALVEHRKALELRVEGLGEGHPVVMLSRNNLAGTLVDAGHFDEARDVAETGWAQAQERDLSPLTLGNAAFVLARALWPTPGAIELEHTERRQRALVLARRAREVLGDAGPRGAEHIRDVDAWLEKRGTSAEALSEIASP